MDNHPPSRKGKRATKPERVSPRAAQLPDEQRAYLLALAAYMEALKASSGLGREAMIAETSKRAGRQVSPSTISDLSSQRVMARKSDVSLLIVKGLLESLGSSLGDMERAMSGETSADEWELLAYYRMLPTDAAKAAARADVRTRGRVAPAPLPRQALSGDDSFVSPPSREQVAEHRQSHISEHDSDEHERDEDESADTRPHRTIRKAQ